MVRQRVLVPSCEGSNPSTPATKNDFVISWQATTPSQVNGLPREIEEVIFREPRDERSEFFGALDYNVLMHYVYLLECQQDKSWYIGQTDDPIVPLQHGIEVAQRLPKAYFHTFKSRGHFFQPIFPELLKNIKQP